MCKGRTRNKKFSYDRRVPSVIRINTDEGSLVVGQEAGESDLHSGVHSECHYYMVLEQQTCRQRQQLSQDRQWTDQQPPC